MDEREHHEVLKREFETPRPARSMPVLVAAGLAGVLIALLAIMLWPRDTATTSAVTDSSPRVERAPVAPPAIKPPGDLTQPVPKAPAQ